MIGAVYRLFAKRFKQVAAAPIKWTDMGETAAQAGARPPSPPRTGAAAAGMVKAPNFGARNY